MRAYCARDRWVVEWFLLYKADASWDPTQWRRLVFELFLLKGNIQQMIYLPSDEYLHLSSILLWCRVNKENRAAGVLDNFSEGEKYAEHGLRKYVRGRAPEIMPSLNSFFTSPNRSWMLLNERRCPTWLRKLCVCLHSMSLWCLRLKDYCLEMAMLAPKLISSGRTP